MRACVRACVRGRKLSRSRSKAQKKWQGTGTRRQADKKGESDLDTSHEAEDVCVCVWVGGWVGVKGWGVASQRPRINGRAKGS